MIKKVRLYGLCILILLTLFLTSCSMIQGKEKKEKVINQTSIKKTVAFPAIEIKTANSIATDNIVPQIQKEKSSIKNYEFVLANDDLKYDPNNFFSTKQLSQMHELELKYLRFQIYDKYNYNYKEKWYENYYKLKLGDVLPVEYSRCRMNRTDKYYEGLILKYEKQAIETDKKELGWMPVYKEHIAKDLAPWTDTRYFLEAIDEKNERITFSDGKENYEIFPVNPILVDQIDKNDWQKFINQELDLKDYKDLSKSTLVYSALFTYRKLRYLVSLKTVAGKVAPTNYKTFYVYYGRRERNLKRVIECLTDKEYDYEIYYDRNDNIELIIQKIISNRKIEKINFYKPKIEENSK